MKKKLSNINNKIYLLLLLSITFILLLLIIQSISIGKVGINNDFLNPLVLIIISIVYLLLIYKISKKIISSNRKYNIAALITIIISFIIMLIIPNIIACIPNNDLSTIISESNNLRFSNTLSDIHYFSMYPNNMWILYIVTSIYRLADIMNLNCQHLSYIFSAISVSLSFLFIFLSIKKISNSKVAFALLLFTALNPIFYLYITYYYNDIFTLFTISLLTYLLLIINSNEKLLINIILGLIIGTLSYISFKIRAVAIFVLIAFYAMLIFTRKIKKIMIITIPIILGIIIGIFINNTISNSYDFKNNKEEINSYTHFIMMGLNKKYNGIWNLDDYLISYNAGNYDQRKKVNKEEIKKRLSEMSLREKIDLFSSKYKYTWANGDCGYFNYYNIVNSINHGYEYIVGNKTLILNYILQVNRIVLYILSLLIILFEINHYKEDKYNFIILTIIGAFLFYTFWESHPRYSLSFLPIFIIMVGINYEKLTNFNFEKLTINYNKQKKVISKNELKKTCSYLTIGATIILYIINYSYYTKPIFQNRKSLYTSIDTLNKNYYIKDGDEVIQYFKTNLNFNEIKIKVYSGERISGNVTLQLYNDKNKLLYKKTNYIDNSINIMELTYKLNKTYNTKSKKYYIKIDTNIEDNKLALVAIHGNNYDYLVSGKLLINNIDTKDDLKLNMNEKISTPRIPKKIYLLIFTLSIGIELYAFDILKYNKKNK